jgi:hypothetical protein
LFHYFLIMQGASKSSVITPEDLVGEEWAAWYQLDPLQRWEESARLWQTYLTLGGSLDPEPDTQSPFFDGSSSGAMPAHGRSGLRVLRRSGV